VGIIRRVLETGRTVIFTTHDPNAAAAAADEVVLMRQGCVLGAGRVRETLTPASLSATYDVAISVLNEGRSRPLVELYDQGGKSWNP